MLFRCFLLSVFLCVFGNSQAQQSTANKWSLLAAFEVNYTGNNSVLHALYSPVDRHSIEAGLNYNFSDGFSANPVLGFGVSYGYSIVKGKNWQAAIGMDYRRQKPLSIVNIQVLTYTTKASYQITDRLSAYSRLGYGLAVERARSAGAFSQSNNITGSFSLGCVFGL